MTNPISFTTGQVSGATWLHPSTLYRFTRDFPQYFSEAAKGHGARGRRWNQSDFEVIEAIRMLHHSRLGKVAIEEQLAMGWRPVSDRADLYRMIVDLDNLAETMRSEHKEHEAKTEGTDKRLTLLEGRQKNIEIQLYRLETAFTKVTAVNNLLT
jgi:hypothetical protein